MADANALAAILGISGQLLDHSSKMQNIRTTALLERDRMEFEQARIKKAEELEYNKSVFQVQMRDIKNLESDLQELNTQYTDRTGIAPENPTVGFTEFHEKQGNKAKDLTDVIAHQAKQQHTLASDIAKRKSELLEIDNALDYIQKNVSYAGGSDPEKWDPEDYTDAIAKYKVNSNITDLSTSVLSAINKKEPGSLELQELNLKLAEKNAKETQTKLDLAKLGHHERNLDQTKIMMDIKSDRETLGLFPELQSLVAEGANATELISEVMQDKKFPDNSTEMLAEAYENISANNPLFALVGHNTYLGAYGGSTGANAAPEYFVNEVIVPSIKAIQVYGEFMQTMPPSHAKTFKTEADKKAYEKERKTYLDGILATISKDILGKTIKDPQGSIIRESIVTVDQIKAAISKLKGLLGSDNILDNRLISYAQLIGDNVTAAQKAGLDGEGDLSIHIDPHIQQTLEALNMQYSGDYKGSKQDEISLQDPNRIALDSLYNQGEKVLKYDENSGDLMEIKTREEAYKVLNEMGVFK